ncbi:MAG: S41 family peptidase [Bacteroidota bacterium]
MKLRNIVIIVVPVLLLLLSTGFVTDTSDDLFEISKNLDIFGRLYREVNVLYVEETDPSRLMKTGIDAMLKSLDPYTTFVPEEEADDIAFMSSGEYGGIGAMVLRRDGKFVVSEPYEGTPADRAGLKPGDYLLKIGDTPLDGKTMDLNDVRNLLRGEKSSGFDILIKRPSEQSSRIVSMVRDRIKVKNVPYVGMMSDHIGYIALTGFTKDASREMQRAYEKLKEEDSQLAGIVLDLRNNPGGRLDEAVRIVNLFVPQRETVVETRGRQKNSRRVHYAQRIPIDTNIKMAVLVNGKSASASEIVAGAMQDLDRAVIMGQKSFGKGLVQNIRSLAYNTQLKITSAKYYTPSGRCIQALDYGDKDESGRPRKIADSLRTTFYTRNGRPVLDGGGIQPDLNVSDEKLVPLVRNLEQQGFIFDFATKFAAANPSIATPKEFQLSNEAFREFTNYVEEENFDFETQADRELFDLKQAMEQEKYTSQLSEDVEQLEAKLKKLKIEEIFQHEEQISWLLTKEILKRYYLRAGILEASVGHDKEIREAAAVLKSPSRYKQILRKGNE